MRFGLGLQTTTAWPTWPTWPMANCSDLRFHVRLLRVLFSEAEDITSCNCAYRNGAEITQSQSSGGFGLLDWGSQTFQAGRPGSFMGSRIGGHTALLRSVLVRDCLASYDHMHSYMLCSHMSIKLYMHACMYVSMCT